MSQVSILSQVTLEALPGHRSALFACRCFLARWSWAVRPRSLNGAALAVLIGNRVGGRVWMTGSFDGPGSCASPRRSDTARYPSLVIPCPLKRSQGTSTIQHHQWSPMTAGLVAEMAAAGDAERPAPRLVCRDGLPKWVGDVRARQPTVGRTPCLVYARQTALTCPATTR